MKYLFFAILVFCFLPLESHSSERHLAKAREIVEFEIAAQKVRSYREDDWWNLHLTYNYTTSEGVEILKINSEGRLVVDPGMTDGQIKTCNFEKISDEKIQQYSKLIERIPSELPTNFTMRISSFDRICHDDSKYFLRVIRNTGMQRYIYSQNEKCAGNVPDWLEELVTYLDNEFKLHENCAWQPNKNNH